MQFCCFSFQELVIKLTRAELRGKQDCKTSQKPSPQPWKEKDRQLT